jgi:hypothetical protein
MLLILQLYELERLQCANPALEYQNNTGLISGTAYVVYSVSEDTAGNLQTTVNTLNVTTSSVAVPSITTSKTALDFSFVEQNFSSAPLNYQITALSK